MVEFKGGENSFNRAPGRKPDPEETLSTRVPIGKMPGGDARSMDGGAIHETDDQNCKGKIEGAWCSEYITDNGMTCGPYNGTCKGGVCHAKIPGNSPCLPENARQ